MTWKEFKELVEAAGAQDDDDLWYVDIHPFETVEVERTEHGIVVS